MCQAPTPRRRLSGSIAAPRCNSPNSQTETDGDDDDGNDKGEDKEKDVDGVECLQRGEEIDWDGCTRRQ